MRKYLFPIVALFAALPCIASAASLNPGDLVISEILPYGNETGSIYAFDPNTKILTEIVHKAPLNNPEKMAITSDGKIIVADWYAWDTVANATAPGHDRGIYSIDPFTGTITTILKNGPLVTPVGVVIASNGDLIVIDHGTNAAQGKVLRIDRATGVVLGTTTHSSLWSPQGIVRDKNSGKIYMCDQNGNVFSINESTLAITKIGSLGGAQPQDLIVTENGKLLISTLLGTIYLMDPANGNSTRIFNDDTAGDVVPSGSSFDSLEWIDRDTFAVVNHFSAGDIFGFDFDAATGSITKSEVLYNDGIVYGGPLYIPLGIERYDANPVPEPGTLVLLGSGLFGLAGYGRKKLGK